MNDEITILHVDDDEDIRLITEISLSLDPGFKLHQCASGPEAILLAPKINPDLIILDMVMPEMNGEDTWERLKEEVSLGETPVIFMSARAEENFAKDLLAKGATAIITKPFEPMTLGQEIRDILAGAKAAEATGNPQKPDNVFSFEA
jgi:CheY-like chemotaxis protein